MSKNLFQDKPVSDREQLLRDNCESVEKQDVKKFLSAEQKDEIRKEVTESLMEIEDRETKLKDFKDSINGEMKPFKEKKKEGMKRIRRGYDVIEKDLFAISNQDEGLMEYFDEAGIFQYSRRLTPDERQTRIRELKTGTNN